MTGPGEYDGPFTTSSDCQRCSLHNEIERLQARVEQLKGHLDWVGWSSDGVAEGQAKIEQLREALDVVGWDEWFMRLQIAVRGHKSLINECGERIERARKAAEAKEKS